MLLESFANEIMRIFSRSECDFSFPLHEDNFHDKIIEPLRQSKFKFDYAYGASKLCIIPEDAVFVIKIPFSGYMEDGDPDSRDFYEFCNAITHTDNIFWDYCNVEVDTMREVKEKNLTRYFAETICIGKIRDYPIYLQERAEILRNSKEKHKHSLKEREDIKTKTSDFGFDCFSADWLLDFYHTYGEDEYIRFMRFVDEYPIKDLYSANVGYINEKPVLVDYSGYDG